MMIHQQASTGGSDGGSDGGRRNKAKEREIDDEGRVSAKRSRLEGLRGELASAVVKDCEDALRVLAQYQKKEAKEEKEKARREAEARHSSVNDRPVGANEEAVEDEDDDDDEDIGDTVHANMRIIFRPMMPRRLARMAPRWSFGIAMHNPLIAELMAMQVPAGDPCAFWRMRVDRMMRPPPAHQHPQ